MDEENYFINPITQRKCKIGGKVHKKILKEGVEGVPEIVAKVVVKKIKVPVVKPKKKDVIVTKKGTFKKKEKNNIEEEQSNLKEIALIVYEQNTDKFDGLSVDECKEKIEELIFLEVRDNPTGLIGMKMLNIADELSDDELSDDEIEEEYEEDEKELEIIEE